MPMLPRSQTAYSPPDQTGDGVASGVSGGVSGGEAGGMPLADRLAARIQELEAELRELQHRAKNSLQLVISLLKLQAGRIRDPDARAAYEQTMVRIEALAILYRQLHESGAGTHVDLGRYVTALCEAVREGTPGALSRVPVTVNSDPIQIGLYEAMPLGLIIAELVTNCLHHAFPDDGWIRITVRQQDDSGRARLTVEDNGRALPAGFDTTSEDGMMLAEALAGQLGDTLSTDSDAAGTTASVSFPV
ncbi:sensor histidine kinase [Azospirillum sp. CT11-132]|uniref:sensor histidine kinase n=1 Tax=unclassified Azospirillum TaxID=2630922 RepID=UPI000D64A4B3|nr:MULTISPECIES: sensor histidine kinase [unclassified Azospirillum]QCG92779.1 sensor histidine kinase [Azospirillum sp. TSA2s]